MALLLGWSPEAAAQSQVLVSNIGQANRTSVTAADLDLAVQFTTGSNSQGYTLTSVDIQFSLLSDAGANTKDNVRIMSNGLVGVFERPSTVVDTLTFPSTALSTDQTISFTHSGLALTANTEYWVVWDVGATELSGSNTIRYAGSGNEDNGAAAGWSLGNKTAFRNHDQTNWINAVTTPLKIKISGKINPPSTPTVSFGSATYSAVEGGNVSVTVNINPTRSSATALSVTSTSATADEGTDYTGGPYSVSIPADTSSASFTIATTDDNEVEIDEAFTIAIATPPTGVVTGTPSTATVRIQDNDGGGTPPPVTVSFEAVDPEMTEGDARDTARVRVKLSRRLLDGEVAHFSIKVGIGATTVRNTEDATPDYTYTVTGTGVTAAPTTGAGSRRPSLTFTGHDTNVVQEALITLTPVANRDDGDAVDGRLTIGYRKQGSDTNIAAGLARGSPYKVTVRHLDDENPDNTPPPVEPEISIAAGAGVTEGTAATFTLTANPAPASPLTVDVTVTEAGGYATAGTHQVTIPTTGTATLTVATTGDDVDEPDGSVTATLGTGTGYTLVASPGDTASVPVADNDGAASLPALSVDDASAHEDAGWLRFTVRLSRAATRVVYVRFSTRDSDPVSARAGVDYTGRTNGIVVFSPGKTEATISVSVQDDSHDEGRETFEVVLSHPRGATIADGVAIGTIVNSDPLPNAWLASFGRTVATHVTDAVSDRLRTPAPAPVDSQITLGGVRLPVRARAAAADSAANGLDPTLLQGVAGWLGLNLPSAPATEGPVSGLEPPATPDPRGPASQPLAGAFDLRQFLLGSSFRLNVGREAATRPRLTAWGRFAGTTFAGRDGTRTATTDGDGDVFTGTVGLDATGTRWVAGVAVAHSQGTGAYTRTRPTATDQGDLEQTLTSLHPYLRYALTDRLDVWGLAGYGWGELDLDLERTNETLETQTTLLMGAVGARGRLLDPAATGGYALATRTEALFSQTTSDAITGLAAGDAAAHRLRLILEGSRGVAWPDGRQVTPTVELGLRHDWGDAETGFGLELGGRVQYADPAWGLTVEGAVRGLVAHADAAYEEWGAWGTVRLAPGPDGQGLAVILSPTWGAAASGVQSLWTRQTTAGLTPTGPQVTPTGRLAADLGYGVPAFGTGLVTPYAGTVLAAGADRTYRLGLRVTLRPTGTQPLDLTLEGTRQEAVGPSPPNQGLRLEATWGF